MSSTIPAPLPADDLPLAEAKAVGNPYARAIIGAVIAGLSAALVALNNGYGITPAEWVAIAITFLVAGAIVWVIPTKRSGVGAYGKAITAAVITALGVLGTGLADDGHLSQIEWLTALTALLSGLVVSQVPETTGQVYPHPPAPGIEGPPVSPTVQ